MEEIDNAVVVTATASSKPANANPNAGLAKNPSSKVREEGELSSSDDEAAVLSSKSLNLTCAFAIFFFFKKKNFFAFLFGRLENREN